MKISVVFLAWSRQDILDITLPLWTQQRGVDYEVVVAHGPDAKIPIHPRIRGVLVDHCCYTHGTNAAIAASKGDVVLLTQADLELNSCHHLLNMLRMLKPGHMVSHKHFNEGKRHSGIYAHCLMVHKQDIIDIGGGFDVAFCPLNKMYAFDDAALVSSLLERGIQLDFHSADSDHSMHHIAHPRPDVTSKDTKARWCKARDHYVATHPVPLLVLYAKQFLARHGMRSDQLDNFKVSTDTEAAMEEWQSRLAKENA